MKNENIQQKVITLLERAPLMLTSIKPVPNNQEEHTITFKVSGYIDLISIAPDVIKSCTLTSDTEAPHIAPLVKNNTNNIPNIPNILELALQLVPYNECELLENIVKIIEEEKN